MVKKNHNKKSARKQAKKARTTPISSVVRDYKFMLNRIIR